MTQRHTLLTELTPQPNTADPLALTMQFPGRILMAQVIVGTQIALIGSLGVAPYTYAIPVGALPTGLTLNTATGAITGTVGAIGEFFFTGQVTDASSATVSTTFKLTTYARLGIVNGTPPQGEVSSPYSYTFSLANATGSVTWTVTSGALPPGLTLSTAGVLSGTPTGSANTAVFTVHAVDAGSGDTMDIPCSLRIFNVMNYPVVVNVAGTVGVPIRIDASIPSGNYCGPNTGIGPYTYAGHVGNDAWLSIDANGIITGTPPSSAVSSTIGGIPQNNIVFLFSATDSLGMVATNGVTGTVLPGNLNASIQPQDGTGANVGPAGPSKLKFVGMTVANDGTTATITAPTGSTGGAYLQAGNNLSDVSSAVTARSNLGLGSMATQAASAVAVTGGSVKELTGFSVGGNDNYSQVPITSATVTAVAGHWYRIGSFAPGAAGEDITLQMFCLRTAGSGNTQLRLNMLSCVSASSGVRYTLDVDDYSATYGISQFRIVEPTFGGAVYLDCQFMTADQYTVYQMGASVCPTSSTGFVSIALTDQGTAAAGVTIKAKLVHIYGDTVRGVFEYVDNSNVRYINATTKITGNVLTTGASAGFTFIDRTSSRQWQWYGTGDVAYLFNGGANIVSFSSTGVIGVAGISLPGATTQFVRGNGSLSTMTVSSSAPSGGADGDIWFKL